MTACVNFVVLEVGAPGTRRRGVNVDAERRPADSYVAIGKQS